MSPRPELLLKSQPPTSLCEFTLTDCMHFELRTVFSYLSLKHLGTMVITPDKQTDTLVLNANCNAGVLSCRKLGFMLTELSSVVKPVIPSFLVCHFLVN